MEEDPVTVSLGPIGPLFQQLRSVIASLQGNSRRLKLKGVKAQIQILGQKLEGLCIDLKGRSEAPEDAITRCWMRQVRDLCYDTVDYLDELMHFIHYSSGTRRRRIRARLFGGIRLLRSKTFRFSRKLTWLSLPKVKKLKRAPLIAKLSALAARVEDADERRKTFKLSSPTSSKSVYAQAAAVMSQIPLQFHTDKLNKLLALDGNEMEKNHKVVTIFASAGVGKTALARTLYHQHRSRFQHRAFIRVSRDPDMRRLLTDMLSQIKAPPVREFSDVPGLMASITKHLQGKRYLIIIDDLWTTSTWDVIIRALPAGDYCRIITTTQVEDVALACCSYQLQHIYQFTLSDDQSGKSEGSSERMKQALNLVYNNLPPRLKTSLLYLNLYPEGYTIRKDELVKQWVAEGLITSVHGQDIEDAAGCYFDALISSGMIQSVETNHNGEVLSCTLHHMVLDLIRQGCMEENFVTIVNYFQTILGLPDKVRRLSVQLGGAKGANNIPENMRISQVRSLLFSGYFKGVPSILDYGLLQVLILHIWADQDRIFDLSTIGELYRLRYLKIESNITVKLPGKIRRLRHLGTLQVDAPLCAVPSDIVHLEKLSHLRLPSESILPDGVGYMISLCTLGYFDLGSNSEDNVRGLDELANLQDLQLTCSTGEPAENLKKNMQLLLGSVFRKLSMLQSVTLAPASGSCNGNTQPDYGAVSSMSISCDYIRIVSPAPDHHLQRLELSRHCCIFSMLPKWVGELSQLCIVKIAVKELTKQDIDILKALPALATLSLHVASAAAEMIVFREGEFSVLTYFKFTCIVPWMKFEADAMPNLQKLRLGFNATTVDEGGTAPIVIEHLSSGLKAISAKICCAGADVSPALMKAIRNDTKNPKVQLIAAIYYDDEGSGIVTREGSVEDENNESHNRIHMLLKSSSLPVPEVHGRKDDVENTPSICDRVSIPHESEITDGHTGQVEIHTLPKMGDQSVLERIFDKKEVPRDLPLELLQKITDGFSEENIIGRGGFGQVYKGILPNGGIVAVKRMYMDQHIIDENAFGREVNSWRYTNHENVVRFLGYCSDRKRAWIKEPGPGQIIFTYVNERILCSEYISNGSLDKYITDELRGLEWETRYEIITGICNGLHYLHMEKQIVHMDLKPANILLDDHMIPKITDFGLSRRGNKSHQMEQRFGTLGYMAPEYENFGKTSFKNDIYSLGVIIIELITGCSRMPDKHNVLQRWRHRWKKPPTLLQYQQVTACIDIAVRCRLKPRDRPSISEIISILSGPKTTNWHTGQASPCYDEDDMLGIKPLELRLPSELEKEISCSIELTNDTRNCFAFYIVLPSKQYSAEPCKGIVQPGSKYCIKVTVQQRDGHAHHQATEIIVQSMKIIQGLIDEEITKGMFEEASKVVDEVNLMVVYEPMKLQELYKSRDETNMPDKGITHRVDPQRHTAQQKSQVVKRCGPDTGIGEGSRSTWYEAISRTQQLVNTEGSRSSRYGAISRTEFISRTQQLVNKQVIKRDLTRKLNYAVTVALPIITTSRNSQPL